MSVQRLRHEVGAPLIMGIVNVTPDSFSDGGRWLEPGPAIEHGLRLAEQGAHIVDVGGESTRPGAQRVDASQELARVIPVVSALAVQGVTVSIDTMRAQVAAEALDAGARLINDVSGGLADADLPRLVAGSGVPMIVMHWRGHSAHMQRHTDYSQYESPRQQDSGMAPGPAAADPPVGVPAVVVGVRAELAARITALREAGVRDDQLIVDPGLGFAKTAEHNWQLLAHLDQLTALGYPVLVGASRKRFLAPVLTGEEPADARPEGTEPTDREPAGTEARDLASALISLVCASQGVWGVRVHDVPATRSALLVAQALDEARGVRQESS